MNTRAIIDSCGISATQFAATLLVAWASLCSTVSQAEVTLRVGLYDNPPKVFTDKEGEPSGSFVELLQEIAAARGWNLQFEQCEWHTCLEYLQSGELDLMPGVARSEQRSSRLAFNQVPAMSSWFRLYGRGGVHVETPLDLKNKKIAILNNSVQENSLKALLQGFNVRAQFIVVNSPEEGFRRAADGEIDLAVANGFFGSYNSDRSGLKATPIVFEPAQLFFAAPLTGQSEILAAIDEQLEQWQGLQNSPYVRILARWGMLQENRVAPAWMPDVLGIALPLGLMMATTIFWLRRRLAASVAHLKSSNEQLKATLKSVPDLMFEVDFEGKFLEIHADRPSLLVRSESELVGLSVRDAMPPEAAETIIGTIKRAFECGNAHGDIIELPLTDGAHWFELSASRKKGDPGCSDTVIVLSRDISKRIRDAEQIQHLAEYDQLTTLPNRVLFNRLAEQIFAKARRDRSPVAVVFMDLDDFKRVNDSMGHDAGDELLVDVATRLSSIRRESDVVCRMGGDEFILLLPDTDTNGAASVALQVSEQMNAPFQVGVHQVGVGISLGISMFPEDGTSLDELLRKADTAMYKSKDSGRNDYRFFTASMQADSEHILALSTALGQALERDQIQAHYQPVVALATGEVVGFEALMRWNHPEFGAVLPAKFIPIAESTGAIHPLGKWMLEEAARTAGDWLQEGKKTYISVNVSTAQFHHRHFVDNLAGALAAADVSGESMEIEVTESITLDLQSALPVMKLLKQLEIKVAIDDFGTGYSSMPCLQQLGFHKLKIDGCFVSNVDRDSDREIIIAIIKLAKVLGMEVLAEAVETSEQRDFLKANGCDLIQGSLIADAMPKDEALHWVGSILEF